MKRNICHSKLVHSALLLIGTLMFAGAVQAADTKQDMAAIKSMTGCYLVDYSYTETAALKAGYTLDARIYDVNKNKSIKEWIYAVPSNDPKSTTKVRLQHVLFGTDLQGNLMPGSLLKHQAEDWEFEPAAWYDFTSPLHWERKTGAAAGTWVRRITNLDDGLRYQCLAAWDHSGSYPEWNCANYSPIPGRETRDMGRKDYQTLDRNTRIVLYGNSFLERQDNVKTIHTATERTPLAREEGKNWYVRLPDQECSAAVDFKNERSEIWSVVRETWEKVFAQPGDFTEKMPPGNPPRWAKMMELEETYYQTLKADSTLRPVIESEIMQIIQDYRD